MENELSKEELIKELREKYQIPEEMTEEEAIEVLMEIGRKKVYQENIRRRIAINQYNKGTFRQFVGGRHGRRK